MVEGLIRILFFDYMVASKTIFFLEKFKLQSCFIIEIVIYEFGFFGYYRTSVSKEVVRKLLVDRSSRSHNSGKVFSPTLKLAFREYRA